MYAPWSIAAAPESTGPAKHLMASPGIRRRLYLQLCSPLWCLLCSLFGMSCPFAASLEANLPPPEIIPEPLLAKARRRLAERAFLHCLVRLCHMVFVRRFSAFRGGHSGQRGPLIMVAGACSSGLNFHRHDNCSGRFLRGRACDPKKARSRVFSPREVSTRPPG